LAELFSVGDRVQVLLDSEFWNGAGWLEGTVVQIQPYSRHRSFYWVQLEEGTVAAAGGQIRLVSVLNPNKIRKSEGPTRSKT
jgi:hypothetical protein